MSKRPRRLRWIAISAGIAAVIAILAAVVFYLRPSARTAREHQEAQLAAKPSAPPDLQKYREDFTSGIEAIQRGDGADAVKHLGSFDFGNRAVEQYRLYYLANGHQMTGNREEGRRVLSALWRTDPAFVYASDAGFNLGGLYAAASDWRHAASVYEGVARREETAAVRGMARWESLEARFAAGDVAAVLERSREITVHNPKSPRASGAIAVFRAMTGTAGTAALPLSPTERLTRAESLLRDGSPQEALAELDALASEAPASIATDLALQRGLALHQLRRFEDSNKALEPLTSGPYRVAIPALRHTARNYRVLSAAIDPNVTKTVREKQRKGSIKVKVGKGKKRRTVTKPRYITVTRTVKLVDLAKKQKKEQYERLSSERLKDLLQLDLPRQLRLEVLNALLAIAAAKKQDAYQQQLVREIIAIDPLQDPALQYFWDKAWSAYRRGDLAAAKPLLRFIGDTYKNPNVQRQADYWYARTIERAGDKAGATKIYQRLADAPYADIYAIHSSQRGGKLRQETSNPFAGKQPDWREIAEKEMPKDLRLAYELTALSHVRDARAEIQKNLKLENQKYAEALLADIYSSTGNRQLMYRSLRRAYPQLATVEQDSTPAYFLKMYYPTAYHDTIREEAKKRGVAPELVMGLILQESYYNPRARSAVGATGLMQIMPATGNEIGRKIHGFFSVNRLEDPETNIELGTYYLKTLINRFGSDYLAVAAYNAGQGNVSKWRRGAPRAPMDEFLESIPFAETRNYVKRVTILRSSYARIAR